MTWLSFAAKNVRHEARSYAAFFLSSTFAVWLFYLYASLLFHPDLGVATVGTELYSFMLFLEVVVALFSVLFILYGHAAFLRTRRRELGVLTTLGLLPRQTAGLIWRENAIIGGGAIVVGTVLGVIFSKLFFLGIGLALDVPTPLRFHFSVKAVVLTVGLFGLVFCAVSLISLMLLRRLSPAEIFREAVKRKAPPRFSLWLALTGIGMLGTFCYLSLTGTRAQPDERLMWAVGLAIAGTYLLFAQGGTLLLRLLQRRKTLYWRETNLVTVSQLIHKLKENARVLFMIAILSSIAITLLTLYSGAVQKAEANALRSYPVGMMLAGTPGGVTPQRVEAVLQEQGLTVAGTARLTALPGSIWDPTLVRGSLLLRSGYAIVSESGLNRWIAQLGLGHTVSVPTGHAVLIQSETWYWGDEPVRIALSDQAGRPRPDGADLTLPVSGPVVLSAVNMGRQTQGLVVLEDQRFADLEGRFPQKAVDLTGWMLPQWKESAPALEKLWQDAGLKTPRERGAGDVSGPVSSYWETRETMSLLVFLCSFISLLFFLASGNMLYFKLFTDLQEDRKQFQSLHKLGLDERQLRRIVSSQTGVLFFVPLLVALALSALIIRYLGSLIGFSFWQPLVMVAGLYLLLFGAYFLVARRTYVNALLE